MFSSRDKGHDLLDKAELPSTSPYAMIYDLIFFFFLTTGTQLWQGNQELQSWALFFMSSIISVCIILTQWSSVTVVLFLFWKCAQLRGHVFHVSFYTLSDSFTFNLFPQLTCWMKKYLEESSISTLGSLKDFMPGCIQCHYPFALRTCVEHSNNNRQLFNYNKSWQK